MHSLIGTLGPFGLAAILTAVLIFGTKGGGHAKTLSWGWCLFLSILAGASYAATGWPFSLVRGVVTDLLGMAQGVFPDLTLPAIGVLLLVIIAWKKMTPRQVALVGIPFWYVCASADGGLGILATKIALMAHQLAA